MSKIVMKKTFLVKNKKSKKILDQNVLKNKLKDICFEKKWKIVQKCHGNKSEKCDIMKTEKKSKKY